MPEVLCRWPRIPWLPCVETSLSLPYLLLQREATEAGLQCGDELETECVRHGGCLEEPVAARSVKRDHMSPPRFAWPRR